MSWDCRTIQLHIMVRVHDESDVNQDQLCETIALGVRNAAQRYLEEQPKMTSHEGVEVELL